MNPILAIDFGTSNSLAGAFHDGKRIEAIPLDPASADPTLMRTLLYFPHQDLCHYGSEAISNYLQNDMEGRLFRSFKSHLPNKSYLGTSVGNRVITLENMVGIFLLEIRRRAEDCLGRPIDTAVIGRPARYSMNPEEDKFALYRMQKAAEFAGFKNSKFVPEPLAAALDLRRDLKQERLVLVGDFGGGTSDFTLIRIGPYAFEESHVLGLEGCPLAGDAIDSLFMSQKINEFFGAKARFKVPLGQNHLTMPKSIIERLNLPAHIVHLKEPKTYEFIREVRRGVLHDQDREAIDRLFLLLEDQQIFSVFERIEAVKRALSDADSAIFDFNYPGLEMNLKFSRDLLEQWATPVREKIFLALDRCLSQAGVESKAVDLVCLTGGSSHLPLIRRELEARFTASKLQTSTQFHSVLSGLIEAASSVRDDSPFEE